MKKLSYLVLGCAGLGLVSCSQETFETPEAVEGYMLTINLPSEMSTRAPIGESVTGAQVLNYTVFDTKNNNAVVENKTLEFPSGSTSLNLPLSFVKGGSYKVSFFSQSQTSIDDGVYSYNAGVVSVSYSKMTPEGNVADAYDCFSYLYTVENVASAINENIYMTRPVAQINWGTNDLNSPALVPVFGEKNADMVTGFSMTAFSQLNILTGGLSTDALVEFTSTPLPSNTEGFPAGGSFPVSGYNYLAMQYVLAQNETSGTYDLKLNVSNNSGETIEIPVNNAPLRANYRTNIYGSLLTDLASLNINLEASWAEEEYDVDVLPISVITAENLDNSTIAASGIYKLSGELQGIYNVTVNGAAETGGLDVIIDGSGLTAVEGKTFNIMFRDHGQFPNAPSDITAHKPRLGNYTIQNFPEGTVNFVTGNTTVNIKNNKFDCFILAAGNVNVNIDGNSVDGKNYDSYQRWDPEKTDCGMYLYMIDYDLTFNNNTITNAAGNPLQINGWALNDENGSYRVEALLDINNVASFSGNTITVTENKTGGQNTWTAAIVFYGDGTYYWTNNSTTDPTFTAKADSFMELVKESGNNFYKAAGIAGANTFKYSHLNDGNSVRIDPIEETAPSE